MPNAARLVAALCLALLAFIVTGQVKESLPEGTYFGHFTEVNVVLGLLVGWITMGKRAGKGTTAAINNGITGVLVLVFWGVFVQGLNQMVELAMRNRYGGPFEAIVDSLRISAEYALVLLTVNSVLTLVIGAVVAGLATEYASRTWR